MLKILTVCAAIGCALTFATIAAIGANFAPAALLGIAGFTLALAVAICAGCARESEYEAQSADE